MSKEDFINRIARMKPRQEPLPVRAVEKTENLEWIDYIEGDVLQGSSGERESIVLSYDNGKCTIDGNAVTFSDMIRAIGPNLEFYKKDAVFQKIYEKEMGRRI